MKYFVSFIMLYSSFCAVAQETQIEYDIFPDTRIIASQSVVNNFKGEGTFIISHRFGDLYRNNASSILYDFLGLDGGANIRIGLDYGLTDWLMVGAGRSSFNKTYDTFLKMQLLQQKKGEKNSPVAISYSGSFSVITDTSNAILDSFFVDRFNYSHQILIARKFNEQFSLQLMPTLIHRNLVATREENNTVFAIGAAGKCDITPTFAISCEYFYTLPGQLPSTFDNYTAIGIDISTKGHVFQIQLTNSPFLVPEYYIGSTRDEIFDTDSEGNFDLNLRIGFNITRDFQLGGRVY